MRPGCTVRHPEFIETREALRSRRTAEDVEFEKGRYSLVVAGGRIPCVNRSSSSRYKAKTNVISQFQLKGSVFTDGPGNPDCNDLRVVAPGRLREPTPAREAGAKPAG